MHADRTEDALAAHLAAAMARGEIAGPSARERARLLQAAFNGAIVQWALHGSGTLESWVGKVIDIFVASVTPKRKPKRAARRTPTRKSR